MVERQELWCHSCSSYVQFDIDTELNGNHVLTCPKCGHEHCRVVKDGKVTDIRWDQRNKSLPYHTVNTSSVSFTTTSTFDTTTSSSSGNFLYGSWMTTTSIT